MGQTASNSLESVQQHNSPTEPQPEDIVDDYQSPYDGPYLQVLYGSQTRDKNAQKFASKLAQNYALQHSPIPVSVMSLDEFEPDHLNKLSYLVIIVSTFTDGTPPANAKHFYAWLNDAVQDYRIQHGSLSNLKYSVFGLGSSDYKQKFNVVGKNIKKWLKEMGAQALCRHSAADFSDSVDTEYTPEQIFERWAVSTLLPALSRAVEGKKTPAQLVVEADAEEAAAAATDAAATTTTSPAKASADQNAATADEPMTKEVEADAWDEFSDDDDGLGDMSEEDLKDDSDGEGIVDVEDMGIEKKQIVKPVKEKERKKMLSKKQYDSLTKQRYKIVGSHSGVKLCRWTKSAIRGRGMCYKRTCYGIDSSKCMEATPSLACANKCVFCWRSYTNPTAKEWVFETNSAKDVFTGFLENHRKLIRELKGVPGVDPERFKNAQKPEHCALSLVGEALMYPEINELIDLLHGDGISTFLVSNAQFPEAMLTLRPITQLYLSIDAHSPESLKSVDRPLHTDFWERFIRCMEILNDIPQRTVYRLTLVKDHNMDEVASYARLVSIGNPTMIEVKGVTYAGNDELTMGNVPWHEEVRKWCQQLCEHLGDRYELACEHAHSCCILIADKRMKGADGGWNTWIDYPRFQELYRNWQATGETFTAFDYSAPTPSWALFGAKEQGFAPTETRVRTKGKFRDNLKKNVAVVEEVVEQGGCCKSDGQSEAAGGCCKSTVEPVAAAAAEEGCCGGQQSEGGSCCKTQE